MDKDFNLHGKESYMIICKKRKIHQIFSTLVLIITFVISSSNYSFAGTMFDNRDLCNVVIKIITLHYFIAILLTCIILFIFSKNKPVFNLTINILLLNLLICVLYIIYIKFFVMNNNWGVPFYIPSGILLFLLQTSLPLILRKNKNVSTNFFYIVFMCILYNIPLWGYSFDFILNSTTVNYMFEYHTIDKLWSLWSYINHYIYK